MLVLRLKSNANSNSFPSAGAWDNNECSFKAPETAYYLESPLNIFVRISKLSE